MMQFWVKRMWLQGCPPGPRVMWAVLGVALERHTGSQRRLSAAVHFSLNIYVFRCVEEIQGHSADFSLRTNSRPHFASEYSPENLSPLSQIPPPCQLWAVAKLYTALVLKCVKFFRVFPISNTVSNFGPWDLNLASGTIVIVHLGYWLRPIPWYFPLESSLK